MSIALVSCFADFCLLQLLVTMNVTEKIYKCGHCGDTNDSLESLKEHMVSVHVSGQQTRIIAGAVQQPAAAVASTSAEMMVIDTEQPAPNPMPAPEPLKKPSKFKCGNCGILVGSMDELKSHMLSDHVKDSETAKELSKPDIPQKG